MVFMVNWRVGFVDWHGAKIDIPVNLDIASIDTRMLLRPQGFHDLNIFIAPTATFGKRNIKKGELLFYPANTHAADNTAVGKSIQCGDHFRHDHGVAVGKNHHTRAQTHSDCGRSHESEHNKAVWPGLLFIHV